MQDLELGPNGGLLYCMEYLNEHVDEWVTQVIDQITAQETPPYLLLIYQASLRCTHGTAVSQLLQKLVKRLSLRLTVVQLIDATLCRDATQFLSATVISLATMVRLELPTISVLSKTDLLLSSAPGDLLFDMGFFLDCQGLDRLVDYIDGSRALSGEDFDISEDEEYQKPGGQPRVSIL
ncbi:Conserved hypothetical ATP binding protein [Fragilaria crotonensis]|nr:Conserved hypothetical ATP binding protein [Fragilaria crotonensis]